MFLQPLSILKNSEEERRFFLLKFIKHLLYIYYILQSDTMNYKYVNMKYFKKDIIQTIIYNINIVEEERRGKGK